MGEISQHVERTSTTPLHDSGTYSACFIYIHTNTSWFVQNIVSKHDKWKRWNISNHDQSTWWYFLKTYNYWKIILKILCYLSHCGMWDGRVWVPYSWYLCRLENFFQKVLKILLPSSVFYMPAKPRNINYDNLSNLLCIEFVQNELDPCWEIYHTPKIKTFLFRKIHSSEVLLH